MGNRANKYVNEDAHGDIQRMHILRETREHIFLPEENQFLFPKELQEGNLRSAYL